MFSSNILHDIVNEVNEVIGTDLSEAITGFSVENISTPITKIQMSFTSDDQVVVFNSETQKMETSLKIRMKTFIPVNQSVIVSRSAVEQTLLTIAYSYIDNIVSYQIEALDYDDDIKCYSITSYINLKDSEDI